VVDNGVVACDFTPPHDITGKSVKEYLPKSEQGKKLLALMEKSYKLLKDHPINQARIKAGKRPANSLWFWGEGTKPNLQSFKDRYNLNGAIISAVDLLKGIAVGASMQVIEVEGANGGLHTNYAGKVDAALKALTEDGYDFVYIHVEAPDEMGHQGSYERKIQAIQFLDEKVIKRVAKALDEKEVDYRMLVLPDHPTPICVRTHTSDPVPYMLYDSTDKKNGNLAYNEKDAKASGVFIEKGHEVILHLFEK
jgi:2,3-bisphosphoglycerate-independent phosphoglycerate mutase